MGGEFFIDLRQFHPIGTIIAPQFSAKNKPEDQRRYLVFCIPFAPFRAFAVTHLLLLGSGVVIALHFHEHFGPNGPAILGFSAFALAMALASNRGSGVLISYRETDLSRAVWWMQNWKLFLKKSVLWTVTFEMSARYLSLSNTGEEFVAVPIAQVLLMAAVYGSIGYIALTGVRNPSHWSKSHR